MLRGTGFGAALRPEFTQSMRAELLEAGLAAPLLEPITKSFGGVRFSKRRHQIDQVAGLGYVNALAQWREDRQFVRFDDPRRALRLGEDELLHLDCAAVRRSLGKPALHLWPELYDIGAPYTGVEQYIES